MKNFFRSLGLLSLLAVFALLPVRVLGQDQQVSIQFSIMALVDLPITDMVYGSQHLPFTVKGFSRSALYQYNGPSNMKFYRMQDKNGVKVAVDAGSVELPANAKKVLLVFAGTAPDFTIGALDDSAPGFLQGTARLSNATVFKLQLRVNDKTVIELAPGDSKVMPAPNGIGVEVSYFKDNKWITATSNAYDVPKTSRMNIFMLTSDNSSRFMFPRAVQLFTQLEKPNAPATPTASGSTPAPGGKPPAQPGAARRQ